jgi:predicted Abi (CAAX) family protease
MATSNYARYAEAPFNRPEHYPLDRTPDPALYRPTGPWMGRLALPKPLERAEVIGAWLVVTHAPDEHRDLLGRQVRLRWEYTPSLNAALWGATRNVHFDEDTYQAIEAGTVLPERVNGMVDVNPLESLAAAHPLDDVCVRLQGEVRVWREPGDGGGPILFATRMPAEITGRFYGLVRFLGPAGGDSYRVRHFSRAAGDFSGPEELVQLPEVVPDANDTRNSARAGIERSPCNEQGWYIYGDQDAEGRFVVRSLAPRQLLRLQQQVFCDGVSECMDYIKPKAWKGAARKGAATSALLVGQGKTPHMARAEWQVGDRALLIHLFGGIGGNKVEPAAKTPLYWGHTAFGEATVVDEPLAGEPVFDIVYHQVYAHNTDGLQAGAHHYSRYSGDRQFGWAGVRPIQDMLIKIDGLTSAFSVWGRSVCALDGIIGSLEVMEARYRIADGRGGTKVGATNNCAQDSAQALYGAIRKMTKVLALRADVREQMSDTAQEAGMLTQLDKLGEELQRVLVPWGSAREDWEYGITNLGESEGIFGTIGKAVSSWRTMLPPVAARAIAEVFLENGATIWVLRTYQVGGDDPDVEPIVPNV